MAANQTRELRRSISGEGYSPRCSCIRRTARSRPSGENLFVLFMAPFSQEWEPPRIPGRFILCCSGVERGDA